MARSGVAMKSSPTQQFNQLSPCLVRFLARDNRRLLSLTEISERAHLPVKAVRRIARLYTWDSPPLAASEAFAAACGHDLLRPRRNLQYLMRFLRTGRGFAHLSTRQLAQFKRMLDNYLKAI